MHAACYTTRTHVGAVENQRRTDIFEEDAAASYIMYQTLILSLFLVILMSLDVKYQRKLSSNKDNLVTVMLLLLVVVVNDGGGSGIRSQHSTLEFFRRLSLE